MNSAYYTAIGIDVSDRKSKICVMSTVFSNPLLLLSMFSRILR